MPDSPTEERWTVYVCPECGEKGERSASLHGPELLCYRSHRFTRKQAREIEVAPASQVEALQEHVEELEDAVAERSSEHALRVEAEGRVTELEQELYESEAARKHAEAWMAASGKDEAYRLEREEIAELSEQRHRDNLELQRRASEVAALQAEVKRLREIGGELIEAVGWLGPGSRLRLTYSGQPDAVEDFEEAMQRLTASLFAAALSPQPEERSK